MLVILTKMTLDTEMIAPVLVIEQTIDHTVQTYHVLSRDRIALSSRTSLERLDSRKSQSTCGKVQYNQILLGSVLEEAVIRQQLFVIDIHSSHQESGTQLSYLVLQSRTATVDPLSASWT